MHAYVAAVRRHRGPYEVLLGQKSIYLPPHRKYQFATIGRNAVQYIIPGGRVNPGESVSDAALREFLEATGVKLSPQLLTPLYADAEDTFFQVDFTQAHSHGIEVETINQAIAEARTESLAYDHFAWFTVELATSALGNKAEYASLPWVTAQIMRALNAGFQRQHINERANDPHTRFALALAQLMLDVLPVGDGSASPAVPSGSS